MEKERPPSPRTSPTPWLGGLHPLSLEEWSELTGGVRAFVRCLKQILRPGRTRTKE